MVKKKDGNSIPLLYKIILKRLEKFAFLDGRIPINKARSVLTYRSRVPKNLVTPIFMEMKKEGWIKFSRHNIFLLVKVECDMIPKHLNQTNWN
jgi:hypothetical protein